MICSARLSASSDRTRTKRTRPPSEIIVSISSARFRPMNRVARAPSAARRTGCCSSTRNSNHTQRCGSRSDIEQNAKHSASQYRHIFVSDEGVSRNSWNIHKVLYRHEDLAEAVADRFGIGHDVDVGTVKSRTLKCINDAVENRGGANDTR